MQLSVKYRRQIKKGYGGAACCRMVLESAPVKAGMFPQAQLYADIKNHSSAGWTAGPDGVRWTMNHRKGGFGGYFVIYDLADFLTISRKLVWTIFHYKVAPLVLVYPSQKWGAQHWMVVQGYQTSRDPKSSGDAGYAVQKFLLTNPWPGIDEKNLGMSKPTWVTLQELGKTYLAKVKGGIWNGKYVAVCDPDPPAEERGEVEPVGTG